MSDIITPDPVEDRPTPQADAVKKASSLSTKKDATLSPEDAVDATEWFLSDSSEEATTKDIEINVGVTEERWVRWTIRALDRDRIRELRKEVTRRGASVDDMSFNLRVATEGTTNPDLRALVVSGFEARNPDGSTVRLQDPADVLRYRLRHKPGLIDQISGEVMEISGYGGEDVREVAAGKS